MPRHFNTPCIVCGKLARGNTRCEKHRGEWEQQRRERLAIVHATSPVRDKYKGDYGKKAKAIKQYALEKNLPCGVCGVPLVAGDDIHADHKFPRMGAASPLQAVHAKCNLKKGNRNG